MHQCLTILDIQFVILEFCYNKYGHNSTMVALARTCKTLSDPALTLLWARQNSLTVFLRHILPKDLCKFGFVGVSEGERGLCLYSMTRDLTDKELERIYHYGSKMRILLVKDYCPYRGRALAQLTSYRPTNRIFSSLNHLTFRFKYPRISAGFEYIPYLLGESLQQFTIEAWKLVEQEPLHIILSSVSKLCPKIANISLLCNLRPENVKEGSGLTLVSAPVFLGSYVDLDSVSLSINRMTPELISQLGRMKLLRSLSIHTSSYQFKPAYSGGMPDHHDFGDLNSNPLFSSPGTPLRAIELVNSSASDIHLFLKAAPNSLELFSAKGYYDSGNPNADFAQLIYPLRRFNNMRTLVLNYCSFNFVCPITSPSLSALLNLRSIRSVSIHGIPSIAVTNRWIKDISEAWPHLEVLDVGQNFKEETMLILEDLNPISLNCKNLAQLSISVKCLPFDFMPEPRTNRVRSLRLLFSPLEHPEDIFDCILALFPSLRTMEGSSHALDSQSQSEEWKRLNKIFKKTSSE